MKWFICPIQNGKKIYRGSFDVINNRIETIYDKKMDKDMIGILSYFWCTRDKKCDNIVYYIFKFV
jgi:hypothetical protein